MSLLLPLLSLALADEARQAHLVGVLTSNEFGASRRHTVRWADSPTLAVIGGTDAQRALAERIAADLSEVIAPLSLILVDEPEHANIRLYFDSAAELTAIARREGFEFVPGNAGLFWCWWSPRGRLTRSVILIKDRWRADDPWMQHLLLEEMAQSLGMMNDSVFFPESVVYETRESSGSATALSPIDVEALTLLYSLRPGARQWRVRRRVRRSEP